MYVYVFFTGPDNFNCIKFLSCSICLISFLAFIVLVISQVSIASSQGKSALGTSSAYRMAPSLSSFYVSFLSTALICLLMNPVLSWWCWFVVVRQSLFTATHFRCSSIDAFFDWFFSFMTDRQLLMMMHFWLAHSTPFCLFVWSDRWVPRHTERVGPSLLYKRYLWNFILNGIRFSMDTGSSSSSIFRQVCGYQSIKKREPKNLTESCHSWRGYVKLLFSWDWPPNLWILSLLLAIYRYSFTYQSSHWMTTCATTD